MIGPSAPSWIASKRTHELDLTSFPVDELLEVVVYIPSAPDIVLFVEPFRAVDEFPSLPAINLLRQILIRSELQVITTATPAEQHEWSATDRQLYDLFQPVIIDELSEELSFQVLAEIKDQYEARHQVAITDAAITAAVTLAAEYLPDQAFPGKAAGLLDLAAAIAARRNESFAARISDVRARKEAALDRGDFETASNYRDHERAIVFEEQRWKAEWKNTPSQRIVSVTAQDIAQALTDSQA